jgi:hypothetical protein
MVSNRSTEHWKPFVKHLEKYIFENHQLRLGLESRNHFLSKSGQGFRNGIVILAKNGRFSSRFSPAASVLMAIDNI